LLIASARFGRRRREDREELCGRMIERYVFNRNLPKSREKSKVRAREPNAELVPLKLNIGPEAILVSKPGKRIVGAPTLDCQLVLKDLPWKQANHAGVSLRKKLSILVSVFGRRCEELLLHFF
jgi:hypothetical protein